MNEKLSPMQNEMLSRADAIFAWVSEAAKTTGEFAKEQAPDIAMQFIAYGRFTSTTAIVLAILLIPVSIFLFKIIEKYDVFAVVGGVMAVFASVMLATMNWQAFAMSWFAPKLYLITEIVKLLK